MLHSYVQCVDSRFQNKDMIQTLEVVSSYSALMNYEKIKKIRELLKKKKQYEIFRIIKIDNTFSTNHNFKRELKLY